MIESCTARAEQIRARGVAPAPFPSPCPTTGMPRIAEPLSPLVTRFWWGPHALDFYDCLTDAGRNAEANRGAGQSAQPGPIGSRFD